MISRVAAALSRQLSHPSGAGGKVVARLMNRGNRSLNEQAIALLDVQPGDRVLDLGFGGGLTFAPLWERGATVVGIDHAEDMFAATQERFAAAREDPSDRRDALVRRSRPLAHSGSEAAVRFRLLRSPSAPARAAASAPTLGPPRP